MLTKFVKTLDKDVAEKLRKCGMHELEEVGDYYVFLNTGLHTLNEEEKKKLIYTNTLSV